MKRYRPEVKNEKKNIYIFAFLSFSMHGNGDTQTQTRPDKAVIDGCESFFICANIQLSFWMIGYRTVAKHFKLLQSQGCVVKITEKAEIAINGNRMVGRPNLFECNVFRDSLFHYPTECMSERNIRKFASV